jgi:glycosyltransferase involved in cell wall biosynthesis
MHISLIVATYNRADALLLVLQSIVNQKLQPDEVIIADDGSNEATKNLLLNFKKKSNLNIIHSFQEDRGFRAAESRNKAVAKANFDYIVLIDGDMILHPRFLDDHVKNARIGYFIQGSRALLTKKKTSEAIEKNRTSFSFFSLGLMNRLNTIHSSFLSRIFSIKRNYLQGTKTCNMSFFKKDLIDVNGFNNEFVGWGREDSEFIARLFNKGINRNTLKFGAIQYHLWHLEENTQTLFENDNILKKTINEKIIWCSSGIDKFL